jgi:hypothetical protein
MPRRWHTPTSASRAVLRRQDIEALLAPWVPDANDRAFVARCIVDEGPIHHRVSSVALLRLLGRALEAAGGPPPPRGEVAPVAMRLPPHLRRGDEDESFGLGVPLAALERLAPRGSPEFAVLLDSLRDGPPHHALANAAMVCLLGALLDRLAGAPPA